MFVAMYGRVSTQRQEDEKTIENQIMAVKDKVAKENHTLIQEYKDEGWSGTILARPALDQLRLDAKKKLWEAVIIYDPDRIARKYSYQSLVIDELEELGIKVLFVTTPPAKTGEDQLLYGVKGVFADYERTRISDRFRLGKLRKAREGNIVTTEAPYGYNYIPKIGKKDGYYEVNEQESLVVKMIFEFIVYDRLTIRGVIRKLQELNIKPRKSKRGVWSTSTLTNLLRNETYIGSAYYLKSYGVVPENPLKQEKYKKIKKTSRKMRPQSEWIEISTPSIITKELFEQTRVQLQSNFEQCQRNRKNEYLLAGSIYCTCGQRRNGEGPQKGKHLYYRCSDRVHKFPLPAECKEKGLNARIADQMVWNGIMKVISNPKLIKKQAERWRSNKQLHKTDNENSIAQLKVSLSKIKKEEQRYIRVFGSELISMEQFTIAMEDLKSRKSGIEGQLVHFQKNEQTLPSEVPNEDLINKFVINIQKVIKNLAFDNRQAIVRELVSKIVANQRELTVYGYLPIGKEYTEKNVKFRSISRYRRSSKRR